MSAREAALPKATHVTQVVQMSTQVRRLVLDAQVRAVPGQFVMLWLPGVDERPFSLVNTDPMTLLVARVGTFTQALHSLQKGDWLWWRGPFGHGFHLPDRPRCVTDGPMGRLLLVAGGYGVAPLLFLARRAQAVGWPVQAIIGARTRAELVGDDDLTDLGCEVRICTEDGSRGQEGLVTEVVEQELQAARGPSPAEQARYVYGCGPGLMLDALRALCCQHGLPCQLSYEAVMKCAMGVCGSCARDGLLVCKDGPVLTWSPKARLLSDSSGHGCSLDRSVGL